MIPEKLVKFEHVIPISAVTGDGIEELKSCLRESLDALASQESDAHHKKQLLNLQTSNALSYNEPPSEHTVTGSRIHRI